MSDKPAKPLQLTSTEIKQGANLPLPGILKATTRSGVSEIDPLLADLAVDKIYTLGSASRSGTASTTITLDPARQELLAVEAEDGTTLFIRADALAEAVEQIRPEAVVNGVVDFSLFREPNAASRGIGDVLWKAASVLRLPDDALLDEAKNLALQWAKEKLGHDVDAKAYDFGSSLGVKALMWRIESRLVGHPGLYHWHDKMLASSDYCLPGDPRLQAAIQQQKPILVLIHGTGSYTVGCFSALRADEATWKLLVQAFPGGIFGFEHRSFSESPIENAQTLLDALPEGAVVSLLTHSRGGLVGDLLCLGQVDEKAIDGYRIETQGASDPEGLLREAQEERARLRAIRDTLAAKHIRVARYVRVAAPARGTRILSENLDAALSDFLNLLQLGGGALVGAAAAALGGPVAGETFGKGASSCLGVVKRLVLEIAGRRIDPRMVPGIAAMRTDSPLAAFLAHPGTLRRDGIDMAVIAGDTEFDSLGLSHFRRRIANLFCDWRLFDQQDNDLVVDTDSMYAGLGFRAGAKYLYDQDASVSHFRYFCNPSTRDALRAWLAEADLSRLTQFQPLTLGSKTPWRDRDARLVQRGGTDNGPRPVAILIPGIMGSHIEVGRKKPNEPGSGNRIWFDMTSLFLGKLEQIGDPTSKKVFSEDIFERFYGDLAEYLSQTHVVVRGAYDWRKTLDECAGELQATIERAASAHPGQPIRLLAHSMGGLVARTLMKRHPSAWQKVIQSGGRLVMLGTPNNGSHLMAHCLLGKTDSMRMLERIDAEHSLQEILTIVSGFPGALSLLPKPGFVDTGGDVPRVASNDYYSVTTWEALKKENTDSWYGDEVGGVPQDAVLKLAEDFWKTTLPDNTILNPERVSYVFGQSDKTPCGITRGSNGRLTLLFTAAGDGSVTWESGRIDNLDQATRCWYMPVEHADLTGEEEHFPAIVELLEQGSTAKLSQLPRLRGKDTQTFVLQAAPPVIPSEEELARAMMGSGPRRRKSSRTKQRLKVAVRAGDLRFVDQPIMCGHYMGDPITSAEAALDEVLGGDLSERERLGVYATDIGTSVIALLPPNGEARARCSLQGAVIVGMGAFTGQLSSRQITETVRAGVLHFLLQIRTLSNDPLKAGLYDTVRLYSLLLGWNSTASLSVAESVSAITRGVLEANHQFSEALGKSCGACATVSDLCFIELYRDAAISAARAVLTLPQELESDLKRLGAHLEAAATLVIGEGVMDRLSAESDPGHWARLIVTDAAAGDTDCPPECYETRCTSPIPPEAWRRLCEEGRDGGRNPVASVTPTGALAAPPGALVSEKTQINKPTVLTPDSDASLAEARYYPERLKYVFLSRRARAETVVQQRQPGLIEAIIRDERRSPAYNDRLGHTLFQLMVPLDYKAMARDQARLLLVLDSYTANLPWELLLADGVPLVTRMPVIRQLATLHYRSTVRMANTNSACIISAPSTYGYDKRFGGSKPKLDDLPGAVCEAKSIASALREAGWSESNIVVTPEGREALDIFATLYERPYRVLMIGAHGIFEARGLDGRSYSGVVLSDGLLLTAVEIELMEVVPELVFLSCCHLGSVSNRYSEPNRLAYSLARKLIEMGVRCVIAAGWAVNDEAACTFATTFFNKLTAGDTFGNAIFSARKRTYEQHPGSNTWGAYQAYGDPNYRLRAGDVKDSETVQTYVAVDELLAKLQAQKVKNKRFKRAMKTLTFAQQTQWVQRQLAKCPPDWLDLAEVLQVIGDLYGEYGADGFGAAREAYEHAIQRDDKAGRVGLRTIERLANLEARHGWALVEKGETGEGIELIECGLTRLYSLADVTRCEQATAKNAERAALLGSVLKRKAATLVVTDKPWREVVPLLEQAGTAYKQAVPGDPACLPYNTLNALLMEWLAGPAGAVGDIDLALRCGKVARSQFKQSKDFWDAFMSAEAQMAAWLLGNPLDDPGLTLRKCYDEAVDTLPRSALQWDSIVNNWRLLALFLRYRDAKGDAKRGTILYQLAEGYAPQVTKPPTLATHAATKAEPKAKGKKPRARARPASKTKAEAKAKPAPIKAKPIATKAKPAAQKPAKRGKPGQT